MLNYVAVNGCQFGFSDIEREASGFRSFYLVIFRCYLGDGRWDKPAVSKLEHSSLPVSLGGKNIQFIK